MTFNPIDEISQADWDKLISSIIRPFLKFYKNDALVTKEDLQQEAWIGLLAACERFDPSKGKFVTFAYHHIRGRVTRYVSKKTQKRPPTIIESQLEDNTEYFSATSSITNSDMNAVETNDLFKKVANEPYAYLLIEHFVYDKSLRDLAKQYSVSHQTINNRIKYLLDLLGHRIENETT